MLTHSNNDTYTLAELDQVLVQLMREVREHRPAVVPIVTWKFDTQKGEFIDA